MLPIKPLEIMKKETTQAVREQLQKGKVRFTIKGINSYRRDDDGHWDWNPTIFKVYKDAEAIQVDEFFGSGMNVIKWGPTCVTLYTYDMLGKRSFGKIKYSDINIIK